MHDKNVKYNSVKYDELFGLFVFFQREIGNCNLFCFCSFRMKLNEAEVKDCDWSVE